VFFSLQRTSGFKERIVIEMDRKMLSEMEIGEEGFCSLQSLYGGPALPAWGQDGRVSGIPLTTRTFLVDSEVSPKRSPQAALRVKRLTAGFSVGFPDGAPTVKFLPGHPPKPLPVVGMDPQ
jgi:hypothetical protein